MNDYSRRRAAELEDVANAIETAINSAEEYQKALIAGRALPVNDEARKQLIGSNLKLIDKLEAELQDIRRKHQEFMKGNPRSD